MDLRDAIPRRSLEQRNISSNVNLVKGILTVFVGKNSCYLATSIAQTGLSAYKFRQAFHVRPHYEPFQVFVDTCAMPKSVPVNKAARRRILGRSRQLRTIVHLLRCVQKLSIWATVSGSKFLFALADNASYCSIFFFHSGETS